MNSALAVYVLDLFCVVGMVVNDDSVGLGGSRGFGGSEGLNLTVSFELLFSADSSCFVWFWMLSLVVDGSTLDFALSCGFSVGISENFFSKSL